MREETLSYTCQIMLDEAMLSTPAILIPAGSGVSRAAARTRSRTRTGVNFVNFGHLDTAR